MQMSKPLMETNVYDIKGHVLVTGSCLEDVWKEQFQEIASSADQVYTICLENTHVNMAITKLSAVFGTGQMKSLTFASVDRSPHCTQMHYITHEIERTCKDHVPVKHVVVSEGRIIEVSQEAIDLSKTFAKLSEMVRQ